MSHCEVRWAPTYVPSCEKICIRYFRQGPTQTGLYNHRKLLEDYISDLRSRGIVLSRRRKQRWCAVTVQLICIFVFAYAKKQVFSLLIILLIFSKNQCRVSSLYFFQNFLFPQRQVQTLSFGFILFYHDLEIIIRPTVYLLHCLVLINVCKILNS